MNALRHRRPRYRFLLAYAVIVGSGTAGLVMFWPQQCWGALCMLALGLLTAWIVAEIGSRRLRRRLHQLRETTEAIERGDLSKKIQCLPDDDFVKLAETLARTTARLKAQIQEQDRLRKQLTRSEKLALIGELAATVAHEVNNPLDGLQNSTRIIRRSLDHPEKVRQLLDMMEAGLYRIEMIVRRLLTMSRDEPVNPVPTRMDEIINDAVVFVQPRLDRHAIDLIRDFPPTPLFAQADRVQLAQAFINLMINAADSMETGGKLIVRYNIGDRGNKILLDISDTGCGIAEEHLPRIFEAFYTTKSTGSGTGLGLAVVKRIVEAHQGRIELHSEVGKGTNFRIELPAAKQSSLAGSPAALLESRQSDPHCTRRG